MLSYAAYRLAIDAHMAIHWCRSVALLKTVASPSPAASADRAVTTLHACGNSRVLQLSTSSSSFTHRRLRKSGAATSRQSSSPSVTSSSQWLTIKRRRVVCGSRRPTSRSWRVTCSMPSTPSRHIKLKPRKMSCSPSGLLTLRPMMRSLLGERRIAL
eukprot:4239115-Pleurochrysis_carterae.AAC.4